MKKEDTKIKFQRLFAEESKRLYDEIDAPLWHLNVDCDGGAITGSYYPERILKALADQFSLILRPTPEHVKEYARKRGVTLRAARGVILKEQAVSVDRLLETARVILHTQFKAKVAECLIQFSNEVFVQTIREEGVPRVGKLHSDEIKGLRNRADKSVSYLSAGRMDKRSVKRAILRRRIYKAIDKLDSATAENVAAVLGYADVRGLTKAMKSVGMSWEQELKPLKNR